MPWQTGMADHYRGVPGAVMLEGEVFSEGSSSSYIETRGGMFEKPQRPPAIDGRFKGRDLTTGLEMAGEVALLPVCAGPWCGAIAEGPIGPGVFFALRGEDGLTLEFPACGGTVFVNPASEEVEAARACFVDGVCPE